MTTKSIKIKCPRCSGGGEVRTSTVDPKDKFNGPWSSCPDCKGLGFIHG